MRGRSLSLSSSPVPRFFAATNMYSFTSIVLLPFVAFSCLSSAIPVDPRAVPSEPPGTPTALRGDSDLLGQDGAAIDSPIAPIDYELAPGQKADPDLGFYFDFTNVKNPQPIRGTKGGTDPGPREFSIRAG